MFHFRPLLISVSVAHFWVLAVRPCWAILKKLRSAALAEVQLPEHLARASMMGLFCGRDLLAGRVRVEGRLEERGRLTHPLWLSPGHVFHVTVTVDPAVTGISVVPAVADLWQAMSEVPYEFGGTNPMSWFNANQPAFWGFVEE